MQIEQRGGVRRGGGGGGGISAGLHKVDMVGKEPPRYRDFCLESVCDGPLHLHLHIAVWCSDAHHRRREFISLPCPVHGKVQSVHSRHFRGSQGALVRLVVLVGDTEALQTILLGTGCLPLHVL